VQLIGCNRCSVRTESATIADYRGLVPKTRGSGDVEILTTSSLANVLILSALSTRISAFRFCGLCGHTPRVNAEGHLHVKSLILFTLRNFMHCSACRIV
jgi:hypothetical protein